MHGTLLDQIDFKQADHYSLPRVKQFYKKNGMRAQAPKGDLVFIATYNASIVAALRLNPIKSAYLLRSMCVSAELRKLGIGSAFLKFMQYQLTQIECYCFPFPHLVYFYSDAGFVNCDPLLAPEFISNKYKRYLNNGKDFCLMKHQHQTMLK